MNFFGLSSSVFLFAKGMPSCFAPHCNHSKSGKKKSSCKFFTFPKNERIREIRIKFGLKIVGPKVWRADRGPKYFDTVCSCHFEFGHKVFEPTIFEWNKHKRVELNSPEKKSPRRSEEVTQPEPTSSNNKSQNHRPSTSAASNPWVGTNEEILLPPSVENAAVSALPSEPIQADQVSTTKTADVVVSAEFYFAQVEIIKELKEKLEMAQRMSFARLRHNDEKVFQHTGLPSAKEFDVILDQLHSHGINYHMGWKVDVLPLEDQLLCALMKLRLDLQYFDLAERFSVSTTCVQNVVLSLIYAVHAIFFTGLMDRIPSRLQNVIGLPYCFAGFRNCRIVLDCIEMEVAVPSSTMEQKGVFSHHKQLLKLLIGVAPNATITFVSKLYPGPYSDKKITRLSGILTYLETGDLVLCDEDFAIADLCQPIGVNVNIPPFLATPQSTVDGVSTTGKIARARIHVERAISRLKSFKVLDLMTPDLREHATVIVQTCAALVNFQLTKEPIEGE